MPKYFLPAGTTPLDKVSHEKISKIFDSLSIPESKGSLNLAFDQKLHLSDLFFQLSGIGDGQIVTFPEALATINRFSPNNPSTIRSYLIDKSVVDEFKDMVADLENVAPIPDGNDVGFRFYLGIDANNVHQIVIVPVYGLTPSAGGLRDRENEKEKHFFADRNKEHFALIASQNRVAVNRVGECFDLIRNKDPKGKEVLYFSKIEMYEFMNGLIDTNYDEMFLNFGRTEEHGFITAVMTFLKNGQPINYKRTGVTIEGICFDQGDLIPPPPNSGLVDSSFEGLP